MNNQLKYSIIYGVIRPEISEQLSVGLIIVDGDRIGVRYSEKKLAALKPLYAESEYRFIRKMMRSMTKENAIKSESAIDYLTRYSNNLIRFSPLQVIDLAPSKSNTDWLYRSYVYAGT